MSAFLDALAAGVVVLLCLGAVLGLLIMTEGQDDEQC